MFPTPLHAKLVFTAFDIHNTNALNPVQLEHALHAVGLGDAPKQIVYGIIRQARHESPVMHASPTVPSPSLAAISGVPYAPPMVTKGGGGVSLGLSVAGSTTGVGTGSFAGTTFPQDFHTAPIVSVALDEFLLVVKELAPAIGSSEEVWKGFKCLDVQQRGRIALDTMLQVVRRDENKLVGKLLLNPPVHRPPPPQSTLWTTPPKGSGSVPTVPSRHGSAILKHDSSHHRASRLGQEGTLRRLVEQVAEYKEKGVSFDEWRLALATS